MVVRKYSDHEGLGTVWVSQLFEASDHRFWVATDRGLAEFLPDAGEHEPRFKTYAQRNGLIYFGLNTLTEDSGGNLWLGSDLGALKMRFAHLKIHYGFERIGSEGSPVHATSFILPPSCRT